MVEKIRPAFHERLLKVIEGASYVQKKGRNKEQNYSYAQEADFLDLVKPLLVEHGIIPIPYYDIVGNEQVQTQAGKPANLVTLELELTLKDAFSAEEIVVQSIGQGRDPQDKACYKAMTGAMKYALSKAFMIPTGDDPEDTEEENPVTMKGKVEEKKGKESDSVAAVTNLRYKVAPSVFQQLMSDFGLTEWPDHFTQLSIERQREFYVALKGLVPK